MNMSMKLIKTAFDKISNGSKTIEIRVYDEKRQKLGVGDKITFALLPTKTKKITKTVTGLCISRSFVDLFKVIDSKKAGWENPKSTEEMVEDMRKFYSEEEEKQYGVVAIYFE